MIIYKNRFLVYVIEPNKSKYYRLFKKIAGFL